MKYTVIPAIVAVTAAVVSVAALLVMKHDAGMVPEVSPRIYDSPKAEDRYDPAYQLTTEMVTGRVDCSGGTVLQGVYSESQYQKIDVWACEQGASVHREYWFDADNVLKDVVERVSGEYHGEGLGTTIRLERFARNADGQFIIGGGRGATASAEKKQMLLDAANMYIEQLRRAEPSGSSTPR
jgi:hypothetical protein